MGPDGEPVGTTANAVCSLSLDPPLILVCFDRSSLTLAAVRSHGAFAINVLAAPQQHLSANFARRGVAAVWEGVRHRPGRTGSPRLADVLATLECTVEYQVPGGDHEILVGRVRHAETSASRGRTARVLPRRLYVIGFMNGERAADEGDRGDGPPGDRGIQPLTGYRGPGFRGQGRVARAREGGGQGTGHREGGAVSPGRWLGVAGDHGYSHDVDLRIRMSWRWGWYPGPFGQRKIYDAAAV